MTIRVGSGIIKDGLILHLDAADQLNYLLSVVEVLVVAGGGGGGVCYGGGGGGGGVVYSNSYSVTPGTGINVSIGNGGTNQVNVVGNGGPGGNSSFGNLTAIGGGYGGGNCGNAGGSGGSGGGGSGTGSARVSGGTGTPAMGFDGETSIPAGGGGGGGAGSLGFRRAGGNGLPFTISGSIQYYGGGGSGGGPEDMPGGAGGGGMGGTAVASGRADATPNTGGGGGGSIISGSGVSGIGGSGIVIVRYPGPQKATGGNTITYIGGYTIHTFTSAGTFTPNSLPSNNSSINGLFDLTGDGNTAFQSGGVTYNASNSGALNFDGSNDFLTSPASSLFSFGTGDFTLEILIYPESFSTYTHMIALPDQNTFALKANASDGQIYFYSPSYNTFGSTSGWTLSLNTWNHVVFKRESSIGYAFLNGISRGSKSGFINNFTSRVLNIHNGWPNEFTQCRISNVMIYNRSLTTSEIQQNFNALRGRFGL
jgi:hypothetical protein